MQILQDMLRICVRTLMFSIPLYAIVHFCMTHSPLRVHVLIEWPLFVPNSKLALWRTATYVQFYSIIQERRENREPLPEYDDDLMRDSHRTSLDNNKLPQNIGEKEMFSIVSKQSYPKKWPGKVKPGLETVSGPLSPRQHDQNSINTFLPQKRILTFNSCKNLLIIGYWGSHRLQLMYKTGGIIFQCA